jgi:hypothetical protein
MERKQYIDRIKLVNALSKGKNLNEQAKAVAIRFATQMSKDPDALAKIGQWFKPDLAQRDVDRCKAVATKHGSAPAKPSPATVAPTTRKPSLTIEEKDRLCELGIFCRLEGRFYLTVRGEAWDKQSRPPVEEFVKAWESAKRQA